MCAIVTSCVFPLCISCVACITEVEIEKKSIYYGYNKVIAKTNIVNLYTVFLIHTFSLVYNMQGGKTKKKKTHTFVLR